MQIAVLGMHRSGTSALTRLLGFIGCHLGSADDFNPVRPDNPAGDWERTDVWALNEDVLAALDATWCRVAGFDLSRLDSARRTEFEGRAREIVERLDPRQPWAIKDPRLCLTLPVWRSSLRTPVCVITRREPLEVARSLSRRDGFPLVVGVALWEAYVLESLRHSHGLPRVAVAHRRLMADAPAALRALRQDLEAAGVRGLHDADEAAVREFIDPSLLHGTADPTEQAAYLTPSQTRLAAALEDGSALSWGEVPRLSEGARDLIAGYFDLLDRLGAARRKDEERIQEIEALKRHGEELAGRNAELAGRNAELARLLAELSERSEAAALDLDEVIHQGVELQRLLELIVSSRRFRYGDSAGELLSRALMRPAQPRAAEHARHIIETFERVCRDISQRRPDPADD